MRTFCPLFDLGDANIRIRKEASSNYPAYPARRRGNFMPHITITRPSKTLWRASLDNGPVNLVNSQTIVELRSLIDEAEADTDLAVILFESANPGYFMAHWDLAEDPAKTTDLPPGKTGQQPFVDVLIRLSKLPVLTVSAIRGRARGAGSEFVLATDIRFASRERAVLGQFEVAAGLIPGGGAPSRLPRLVGRGRALEILAGANDFDGDLLERYGYVNRAIPDAEFEGFVDSFVTRVAGFGRRVIGELKQCVDPLTLPDDVEFPPQADLFWTTVVQPEVQDWARRQFERGLQQSGEVEENLGEFAARR
ncbi:enoyl-CoA hydratase/isomerase family protein [Streptomyces sp. NPDC058665]|uniref:enoyl-CoA hydratase/isomerase family protein n=1 Tax=Streptomyces sp. NPDC058665 TaxID=3346586 RepID=UPI0036611C4E